MIWVSNTIQFFLKFIYFVNGNVIWGDSTSLPDEGTTKYVTIERTKIMAVNRKVDGGGGEGCWYLERTYCKHYIISTTFLEDEDGEGGL